MQLKSPLDGIVVTRDARTKLLDRPVERGDFLLQLVANDGKWLAELRVPDSRISHLMTGQSGSSDTDIWDARKIPVTLSVATHPEERLEGVIRNVSTTAEVDEITKQAFILVTVEVMNEKALTFQPGSSVIAEFNCGRSSVGYAWFNEFFDSIRYRFF